MIRRILEGGLLAVFLFFSLTLEAQQSTQRLLQQLGQIETLLGRDVDQASSALRQLKTAIENQNDSPLLSHYHLINVKLHSTRQQFDKVVELAQQAIEYREKSGLLPGRDLIELYFEYGIALEYLGQVNEAQKQHQLGTTLAQQLQLNDLLVDGWMSLANTNLYMDRTRVALDYSQRAFELGMTLDDQQAKATMLSGQGLLYGMLGMEQRAIDHQLQALAIYRELDIPNDILIVLYNIGTFYIDLSDAEQAAAYLQEAATYAKPGDMMHLNIYVQLATIANETEEYEHAQSYLNIASQSLEQGDAPYYLIEYHYQLALTLSKLGQTQDAMTHWQLAYDMSLTLSEDEQALRLRIQKLKTSILASAGQWQDAYAALNEFVEGYADYRNEQTENHVAELSAKHDLQRSVAKSTIVAQQNTQLKQRIAELQTQQQTQQYLVWAGAVVLLCIGLVLLLSVRKNKYIRSVSALDEFSGLANRQSTFAQGERLYRQTTSEHFLLTVVVIRLPHLEQINDDFGCKYGDMAIKAVANMLQVQLQRANIIGRIGGGDFVAILSSQSHAQANVAERLRRMIEANPFKLPECGEVDLTLGQAISDETNTSFEQLVQQALRTATAVGSQTSQIKTTHEQDES